MLHYKNGEPCGLINSIRKYTIHDGPGVRTEIFFKGCNMHCPWCPNPEGMYFQSQLGVYPDKCTDIFKCGKCIEECPLEDKPLSFDKWGKLQAVNMVEACLSCFKCAIVCPDHAIKVWGELLTVEDVMKEVEPDIDFFESTGGGITINGGECLLQWEFISMLLKACHKKGINTCVETVLNVPREHVTAILKNTDIIYTDIKHIDTKVHESITGQGNEQILENIRYIVKEGKPIVIRTPVVAGYNDAEEDIKKIGRFIRDELDGRVFEYQLLPYMKLGTKNYATLNQKYPLGEYAAPDKSTWEPYLEHLAEVLKSEYGVNAVVRSID